MGTGQPSGSASCLSLFETRADRHCFSSKIRRRSTSPHLHPVQQEAEHLRPFPLSFLSPSRTDRRGGTEQQVWIYADITLDDSYTPHKVSVRAGSYHGDLHEVKWAELNQPKGWQALKLGGSSKPGEANDGCGFLPFITLLTAYRPLSRQAENLSVPTSSRSPSSRIT
jgi:hypothetical protein